MSETIGTTGEEYIKCPYCGDIYEKGMEPYLTCGNCSGGFYCRINGITGVISYDTSSHPFDDEVNKNMETNHISNGVGFITNEVVVCNKCHNTSTKVVKIEMNTEKDELILHYDCICSNQSTWTYKLEHIDRVV
jgi:hypothetical protein